MDVVEYLPEEVWILVLDKLKNYPSSLEACYNTCKLWKQILEKRKLEFQFQHILPHVAKYLDHATLLNCRGISSCWKSIVDDYSGNIVPMEGQYDYYPFGSPRSRNGLPQDEHLLADYYMTLPRITKFIDRTSTIVNPFIGKRVIFFDDGFGDYDQLIPSIQNWKRTVNELLPKFGLFIKHCSLNFSIPFGHGILHAIILACLKQMPNLRQLTINYSLQWNFIGCLHQEESIIAQFIDSTTTNDQNIELKYLTCVFLPQTLSLNTFRLLLKDSLKYLSMDFEFYPSWNLYRNSRGLDLVCSNYPTANLPNLEWLQLSDFCTPYISILDKWSTVIYLNSLDLITCCCLPDLLRIAQKFESTLTKLYVQIELITRSEGFNLRAKFVKLETLRIVVPTNATYSFDFLLPLKLLSDLEILFASSTLQDIDISSLYGCKERNSTQQSVTNNKKNKEKQDEEQELENILQITGFENVLYESNIWTLFPKLSFVKIGDCFRYSRIRLS